MEQQELLEVFNNSRNVKEKSLILCILGRY